MSTLSGSDIPSSKDDAQVQFSKGNQTLLELLRGSKAQEIINVIMTVIVLTIGAIVIFMPEGIVPGSTRLWRLAWRRVSKPAARPPAAKNAGAE